MMTSYLLGGRGLGTDDDALRVTQEFICVPPYVISVPQWLGVSAHMALGVDANMAYPVRLRKHPGGTVGVVGGGQAAGRWSLWGGGADGYCDVVLAGIGRF